MRITVSALALSATAALSWATPAAAHPKLLSSSPAANATADKPSRLTLTFSEKLVAPMSGVELTMTGMPGMANHAPMKIGGLKNSVAADGKTLVVSLPRPLSSGTYSVKWHAVAADTHRIQGAYSFRVR